MAALIKKIIGGKPYFYIAVSKRVNGQPRIVHQTYLGSVDRILTTFQQQSTPHPVEAKALDLGLPGALWQAARDSGVQAALDAVWPPPRQGPALSHFLLLAAFHRICNPGPKTKVAAWYQRTVLRRLWGFPSSCFSSQAFWDRFDSIDVAPVPAPGEPETDDELLAAQDGLLQAFRERNLVSQRVLAYDTTNFHSWIASGNDRNTLAQRGRNKQKRNDLRQVGLSYALDAAHGLSLMHHVYPGNVPDSGELPAALERIGGRLDRAGIPRASVTLTMDKGSAALANTLDLERSGLGWVAALPWNQAPPELRQRPLDALPPVGPEHPGLRAWAQRWLVHGAERRCVLQYSETYGAEQLQSVSTGLAKALTKLRKLAGELGQPQPRPPTEERVRKRVQQALGRNYVPALVPYELTPRGTAWELDFRVDHGALQDLIAGRFGRTVLMTNRNEWSAAEVVAAYGQQQHVERVFRGLKGGGLVGWGPAYHWTDSKLKVHAFYCMLGVSLLQYLHRKARAAWPELTLEGLCEELGQVQQFDLVFPGAKPGAAPSVTTVPSSQSLVQQRLVQALGIDRLIPDAAPQDAR